MSKWWQGSLGDTLDKEIKTRTSTIATGIAQLDRISTEMDRLATDRVDTRSTIEASELQQVAIDKAIEILEEAGVV